VRKRPRYIGLNLRDCSRALVKHLDAMNDAMRTVRPRGPPPCERPPFDVNAT
jgi:hypothetical protein